jgi:peptide deformylase
MARAPRKLEIIQLGNPILRERAKCVEDVRAPEVQELIDDMLYTCKLVDGMGLAAPQVGISLAIFVMAIRPVTRYPNAPFMEPAAYINPRDNSSEEQAQDWEGCLSIPGLRGQVRRPRGIHAWWTTRNGDEEQADFWDFPARVFQHESDHLIGRMFTDTAIRDTFVTEQEYQRIISEKK